jgi:hypothetical protein
MTAVQEMAWESMLNAELSWRYWDKKAFRMTLWLNAVKIVSAMIGCGAVASMLLDPGLAIWNKIATLVAAILAIYLSVVDPKNALDQALQARESYRGLFSQYETLWGNVLLGVPEVEINAELQRLRDEGIKIKEPVTHFSKRLRDESEREILAARGMLNA